MVSTVGQLIIGKSWLYFLRRDRNETVITSSTLYWQEEQGSSEFLNDSCTVRLMVIVTSSPTVVRLLEAFFDLEIPELLGMNKSLSAKEICSILHLDLTRGWKFLHALNLSGLLSERGGEHGQDSAVFFLSDMAKEFFGESGDQGYYWRETVLFWRYLNEMNNVSFVDMLRGAALPPMPVWPPANIDTARHLERWMTVTAEGAAATLLSSQAMHGAGTVLDVGGGDGECITMTVLILN